MTETPGGESKVDFFVSRTGDDARWAQWTAWQLEQAGYSVIVEDWDFRPGSNFVSDMRRALDAAETTIALYSPAYFRSQFTEDEWTAALARRADDVVPFLPIRIKEVEVPALLAPIVYVDLVGLDEEAARTRLLDAAERRPRRKPLRPPGFPGAEAPAFPPARDPGEAASAVRVINILPTEALRFTDRRQHIEALRGFLRDVDVRLVTVVGRIGMGKTALASHVLAAERKGAGEPAGIGDGAVDAMVFLCSRSTGLSLERLYADLRRLLDDTAANELETHWARLDLTLPESVDLLLNSVRGRRVIVVLDGLEGLIDDGTIAEEGLQAFVQGCLDRPDAPQIVVTSSVELSVPPASFPVVRVIRLKEGLPTPDAVALLRLLDPQGDLDLASASEDELGRVVALGAGIPRALELLAGKFQTNPALSVGNLLSEGRDLGARIVEELFTEAVAALKADEQRVLETMAAFDTPVTEAAIRFVVHAWFPQIDVARALRLGGRPLGHRNPWDRRVPAPVD